MKIDGRVGCLAGWLAVACLVPAGSTPAWSTPASSVPVAAQPAGEDRIVVRVPGVDRFTAARLGTEHDLWAYLPRESTAILAVGRAELEALRAQGFEPVLDEEHTRELYLPFLELEGQTTESIPSFPCYRTVEETYADLAQIAVDHPTLARWIDLGDSWEKRHGPGAGYEIRALVLGNQALPTPKAPFVLIAAMHARELATAEIATRFAEQLVAGYGVDPDATWILDHTEIHVIPQLNPDGRKRAESGLSWRKNVDNDFCSNSNSRGIDLNRNSTFFWGGPFASTTQCSETYRGPAAASEPETQAIESYLTQVFPDQRGPALSDPAPADATGIFISLHSFGELVLFPWEGSGNAAPNFTQLQTLGRKFGFYNHYSVCQTCLSPASGTTVDVAYGDYGVAGYTFEVGTSFFQSCSSFESTVAPDNLAALRYAVKAARRPYLESKGPDTRNLALSSAAVAPGASVTLTAVADDGRYASGGFGTEPTQPIAAVYVSIDQPAWLAGSLEPMTASDGFFNATVETATATVSTAGLGLGRHQLFVTAEDADGNLGVPTAIFLDVVSAEIFADGFETGDLSRWSAVGR